MITIFRWDAATGTGTRINQLPPTAAGVANDDVVWIDLADPTPEEETHILERFLNVHPLTRDDIEKARREPLEGAHFSKVEEFPDYLLVIVNPLPPGLAEYVAKPTAEAKIEAPPAAPAAPATPPNPLYGLRRRYRPQLSAVITHHILVTHHYQSLVCVNDVLGHLDRHSEAARRGPDYLLHLILDAMVDEYAPVVDRVSSRLDRIERRVFRDPSPRMLGSMLRLKRLVTGMRKTLILEREVLARLTRGEFALVDEQEVAYYRNVYDHLVRYTELIESAREMVGDLMQTHLAAASNRLNQVMKFLTMISTVILPMSLIASIYGMNFKAMPELNWGYGYPMSLGLMVTVGLGSFALFRWRGWL